MADDKITVSRAELKALVRELMVEIVKEQQTPAVNAAKLRLNPDIAVLLRLALTRRGEGAIKADEPAKGHTLQLTPTAEADLQSLPHDVAFKLRQKVAYIAAYAHFVDHQPFHPDWPQFYQAGSGDVRVVYSFTRADALVIETIRPRPQLFLANIE